MISNDKINAALSRLEKVYRLLSCYGYEKYVSFNLSAVANRNYYTGMIFAGYTYGTGDAIVTGGRYDNLVKQFGKETPSIGFAFDLDRLLMAMSRQKLVIPVDYKTVFILYENHVQKEAIALAAQYRGDGVPVTLTRRKEEFSLDSYKEYARRNEFTKMYYMSSADEHAKKVDL
jgi:ATP phosphoribosyltransferase regulatory subunit